jgi:hypothetical protein
VRGGKTLLTLDYFHAGDKQLLRVFCFDAKAAENFKKHFDGYKGMKFEVKKHEETTPELHFAEIDGVEVSRTTSNTRAWDYVEVTK